MHAAQFDAAARRLAAGATSRRGALRTLAAAGAATLGFGVARREAGANRSWIANCLDTCPNRCVGLGDAVTSCEDGCMTCCWQGMFGESRTAPCMTKMLACMADPVCLAASAGHGNASNVGTGATATETTGSGG
ncbi:MAG TPA: hypothetical protein VFU81_21490 [Thermomicrobiales bacterium]|nr:hypothetical protein [Thermomicrobiales bacterium]